MPNTKTTWIENGVVKNLAYDRFWAQRQGKEPQSAGGTLAMTGGDSSVEEMIASTERGLLVTRFWYIRPVDPRTILYTGLTRDGTFLIENGKVTRAGQEPPLQRVADLYAQQRPGNGTPRARQRERGGWAWSGDHGPAA
jgi:predicted Zn-dependent protease